MLIFLRPATIWVAVAASNSTENEMAKRFIIIAGALILIAAVLGGTIGSSKRLRRTVAIGGPVNDRPAEEIEKRLQRGRFYSFCQLRRRNRLREGHRLPCRGMLTTRSSTHLLSV